MTPPRIRHAFTVDVEDWYQGLPLPAATRATAERRLERGLVPLLERLAAARVRGTFFVLGPLAREYPQLLCRIAAAGHEIGCHGWSHEFVYDMTRERFRDETRRARDEICAVIGAPVRAYRAAYFSITRRSFWALEVLAELGFHYDSSIFPVRNWRYGIPDFPPVPQIIDTPAGPLRELPLSVRRVLGRNIPVTGGAYFRIYPYAVTRANLRAVEAAGQPAVFYIHPWELDPGHPRVALDARVGLTHYWNLGATEGRLRRLLADFAFGPLGEVLDTTGAGGAPARRETPADASPIPLPPSPPIA